METLSYVVGVDVCVVPLQPVIQHGDDHSFACDAFLPHGDHVQVQLRQRGGRPGVLLEDEQRGFYYGVRICDVFLQVELLLQNHTQD